MRRPPVATAGSGSSVGRQRKIDRATDKGAPSRPFPAVISSTLPVSRKATILSKFLHAVRASPSTWASGGRRETRTELGCPPEERSKSEERRRIKRLCPRCGSSWARSILLVFLPRDAANQSSTEKTKESYTGKGRRPGEHETEGTARANQR
ncbi:hypothetical protein TGFOU_289520D [Toxoplasma gondii FOU]|uniref:Uncharacterized protein n=1 Tax=Toxoplasma gondii FOU TaxID=943167 RepID=A0A086L9J3_TOXGO|nr:hypothetical protein TGFOU_289520D [Toxoplasma gondii FOU]